MFEEFKRILKKTMHFIVLAAVPFAVYFIMYAKEGIFFLSGNAYGGAIIPMQIIMPTLILIGITNVIGIQMMVPIGAVVDLGLNLILIPQYAAAGAAIGTLVAEMVVLIWQLFAIRDLRIGIFEQVPFIKILLGVVCGIVASVWVMFAGLGIFVTLVVSAACFFGVYAIVLILTKDAIALETFKLITKTFHT